MILLENYNRVIAETITQRLNAKKHEVIDVVAADFDGVKFHVSTTKEAKNVVTVSLSWVAAQDLLKAGATTLLKHEYGDLLLGTPENGYDVSLQFDLDNLPFDGDAEKLTTKVSQFKRFLLAAPFQRVFQAVEKGGNAPPMITIQNRGEEAIYIKPEGDRVSVIFQVYFRDPDDQIIAKIFLQEFRRSVGGAPSVDYTTGDPPGELTGVSGVPSGPDYGFVTFVCHNNHLKAAKRMKVIDMLQTFRNYLHYHIKCSKAYMHGRMRARVTSLLQVLNRAKPEPVEKKARKTMGGKTFQRR